MLLRNLIYRAFIRGEQQQQRQHPPRLYKRTTTRLKVDDPVILDRKKDQPNKRNKNVGLIFAAICGVIVAAGNMSPGVQKIMKDNKKK